jgi:hypothetical protein
MWVECMVLQKELRLRWQKSEDANGQIQVSGRRFLRLPVTAELEEHESAGTASTDAPATCKADAMLHRDKYVSRSGKFAHKAVSRAWHSQSCQHKTLWHVPHPCSCAQATTSSMATAIAFFDVCTRPIELLQQSENDGEDARGKVFK